MSSLDNLWSQARKNMDLLEGSCSAVPSCMFQPQAAAAQGIELIRGGNYSVLSFRSKQFWALMESDTFNELVSPARLIEASVVHLRIISAHFFSRCSDYDRS